MNEKRLKNYKLLLIIAGIISTAVCIGISIINYFTFGDVMESTEFFMFVIIPWIVIAITIPFLMLRYHLRKKQLTRH